MVGAFLTTASSGDIATITSSVGDLVEGGVSWMGQFLGKITESPVLTIFCIAVPLVGLGIGLLKRLISTRG